MVSLPPRPQSTSLPLVPVRVSFPGVPVMVHPLALVTLGDWAAVLLPGSGSGSAPEAVAVAVMVPVAVGSMVIVAVAVAPSARAPRGQVAVGAVMVQEPWVVLAEVMVPGPDRVVVRLTEVASPGPALATVAV